MNVEEVALGFGAIGSKARLQTLLTLVEAYPNPLTIKDIQEKLDIPASTLAHHIKSLAVENLIKQEKVGREIKTTANYEKIKQLAQYLLKECCQIDFKL